MESIEAALVSASPNVERLRDLLGSALTPDSTSTVLAEARTLLSEIGAKIDEAAALA
jgi:hypothetical protein